MNHSTDHNTPAPWRRRGGLIATALMLMLALTAPNLHAGPALGAAPAGTSGAQTFSYTGGLQTYTVPASANGVRITAVGAVGGTTPLNSAVPGLGASLQGDFFVAPGTQLSILVGGEGSSSGNGGGGGGSFVWTGAGMAAPSTLLIAAGGGGGAGCFSVNGVDASLTTGGTGGNGSPGAAGGSNGLGGSGGQAGENGGGGGGAGLSGAGGNGANGPLATGGEGGTAISAGGFGGAGLSGSSGGYGGGGGGSYNGGLNQVNTAHANAGNGQVVIQVISSGPLPTATPTNTATPNATQTATAAAQQTATAAAQQTATAAQQTAAPGQTATAVAQQTAAAQQTSIAGAGGILVCPTLSGNCLFTDIAAALAYAPAGATILIAPGVYTPTATLTINNDGTVEGLDSITGGPADVVVDGSQNGDAPIITVAGAVSTTLSGLTLTGAASSVPGGALAADTTPVTGTLLNSAVLTNTSSSYGGAINAFGGAITVISSTLAGNAGTYGGAINSSGTVTLLDSTIAGNTATSNDGGGIQNCGGMLTVANSTLAGNAAPNGSGGGMHSYSGCGPAGVTMVNSTIAGNSASSGGGIASSAALTLTNTLVTGNTNDGGSADDLQGSYIDGVTGSTGNTGSDADNFVGLSYGGQTYTFGQIVATANGQLLLANNGGPTQTIAESVGSPAINHGDLATCQAAPVGGVDQRGVARPTASCTIGAYDAGASAPPTATPTATNTPSPTSTPTNTPVPPTSTPTNTPAPPTVTSTPTNTPAPTSTPTNTPVPPTATSTPTGTPGPSLSASPLTVTVGQAITLAGAAFGASEPVALYWDSTATTALTTTTTTSAGGFTVGVKAPAAVVGTHTLIAVGQSSQRQATASVNIQPTLTLAPTAGRPGAMVKASGSGFGASEQVTLHWKSAGGRQLGATTSSSVGNFGIVMIRIPSSAPGTYKVYAVGARSKAQASATFRVT